MTIRADHALILFCLTMFATPAVQAGKIETLPKGQYQCATPGDAGGDPLQHVEGADFIIINASSYKKADGGRGTYLLTGKTLVFTKGPLNGVRFERTGENLLRQQMDDGTLGRMRCGRISR